MRDGKVNWSKFSQMGRSAAIVLDCAKEDAQVFDRAVDRCILNVPLVDKDVSPSPSQLPRRILTLLYRHNTLSPTNVNPVHQRTRPVEPSSRASSATSLPRIDPLPLSHYISVQPSR